jgi:membrane-associated protein
MEILSTFIGFFTHLDDNLTMLFNFFGIWMYVILFLIIFAETGLIIFPFLPGDSLLFTIGAFAAIGHLDVTTILILLFVAAVLGDSVNYWIGRYFGKKIVDNPRIPINQEHLDETEAFYKKNGGKTIILARFIPFIRTFAPFVAGASHMNYRNFMIFNIVGGFAWVFSLVLAGYYFGNIQGIKENMEIGIILVILVSLLPVFFEFIKVKVKKHKD